MENKIKKVDEKKTERAKDRGDKMNLLVKVLEDLDITDFLPNRDRGDSRAYFGNRSTRNLHSEKTSVIKGQNSKEEKRKSVIISPSEVKTKKPEYILDSDDSSKKEHHVKIHKEERKRIEESKGRPSLSTVKDVHKTKTEQKARAYSEQVIKSKPELVKIDDTRRIDENARRVDEKPKRTNENKGEEGRRTDKIKNLRLPPGKDLKFIETGALERRKLLRQRYTVKLKSSNKNVESKHSLKNYEDNLNEEASEVFNEEKRNESPKNILHTLETTKPTKKFKDLTQVQRRPIIKTIRNNDHRVYKAVTFIDQKETTPLQIKMPNSKKSAETNTAKNKLKTIASKVSVQNNSKEKTHARKTKEKRGPRKIRMRPASPALTTNQSSPQTEVAKWAPSSINQHTKPYYEAWVDTTLAAITKCSEKDKLKLNKQQIFRTFKRAFELDSRPNSPHLIYEKVNDEKYMGKITVYKSK